MRRRTGGGPGTNQYKAKPPVAAVSGSGSTPARVRIATFGAPGTFAQARARWCKGRPGRDGRIDATAVGFRRPPGGPSAMSTLLSRALDDAGLQPGSVWWETNHTRPLRLDEVVTDQTHVNVDHVAALADAWDPAVAHGERPEDRPYAFAYDDRLYLRQGHHRLIAAHLRGEPLDVLVIDIDAAVRAGAVLDAGLDGDGDWGDAA